MRKIPVMLISLLITYYSEYYDYTHATILINIIEPCVAAGTDANSIFVDALERLFSHKNIKKA